VTIRRNTAQGGFDLVFYPRLTRGVMILPDLRGVCWRVAPHCNQTQKPKSGLCSGTATSLSS